MITKVEFVATQVSALLDDPGRSFSTIEYQLPFLQLAQDQLENEVLQNPNIGAITTTVVIPDVPARTFDLANYFDPQDPSGGPLQLLIDVISMKERTVGGLRQDQDWNFMSRVNDIPTIQPVAFNSYYALRDNTIVLSGADQVMDLRIFGKFKPGILTSKDSPIVPNTSIIISHGAAGLIAGSRGNETMDAKYAGLREIQKDDFFNHSIMEMQAVRIRQRSYSGRGNIRV